MFATLPATFALASVGVFDMVFADGYESHLADVEGVFGGIDGNARALIEAAVKDPATVSLAKSRLEATLAAEGLLAARIGEVQEGSGVLFR